MNPGITGTPESPAATCRILLVNDRPAELLAIQTVLAAPGVEVVTAPSGRDALRHLLRDGFDLALIDVNMPGLDGFQTAALIRQRPSLRELPIVFITATEANASHQVYGLKLGGVDYIYAPVEPEVLRAKVDALLRMKREAADQRRRERQQHQAQLQAVSHSLDLEVRRNRFFSFSIDLLSICDFGGCLRQLSPSWERNLGYAPEELIGRRFLDFIHPDDGASTALEFQKLTAGQPVAEVENRFRAKDGSYRWLLWNAVPYPAEELIYAAARDCTDRKQAERAIVERQAQLAASNQELEAFAYSASHDLKAPLRTIAGFADMLLESTAGLAPDALRRLEQIRAAARHMTQLIEDLLRLSRVEKSDFRRRTVDLSALARSVLAQFREREPHRDVAASIHGPLVAQGDPDLLRILLVNLLGNAWKYTARNPHAHIRLELEESSGERIYWVRDDGVGFDISQADKLFQPFQRLHSETDFPGTGIGLATVQRIVRRHGGRVWALSAPGQGASLAFTLGDGDLCHTEP